MEPRQLTLIASSMQEGVEIFLYGVQEKLYLPGFTGRISPPGRGRKVVVKSPGGDSLGQFYAEEEEKRFSFPYEEEERLEIASMSREGA